MPDIAIRVENLGKRYQIGRVEKYFTLRDTLNNALTSPFRRMNRLLRGQAYGASELNETIWALKDVSFEVKEGEVIGIIGKNGAGKSTLLKLLSRITEPTLGQIEVYGRVASLLEVGTGFHGELTGRENIYLNGAILGMSRNEINRKFDEIVDFSGVEKFIDTPVKHYSSGMGLRLGFAVAAHLEPDILIVDEVLAVGDFEFQRKCLGKMQDVAGHGRTVLFVSHNMNAILSLCSRCVLLNNGQIVMDNVAQTVVGQYLEMVENTDENYSNLRVHPNRRAGAIPLMTDVWVHETANGLEVTIQYEPHERIEKPAVGLTIIGAAEQKIFSSATYLQGVRLPPVNGVTRVKCIIPELPLLPETYYLNIAVGTEHQPLLDAIDRAVSFSLLPRGNPDDLKVDTRWHGFLRLKSHWKVENEHN